MHRPAAGGRDRKTGGLTNLVMLSKRAVKRKQPIRPEASGCNGMHRPAAGGREAASVAQRNLVQLAVIDAEDRRSDKSFFMSG